MIDDDVAILVYEQCAACEEQGAKEDGVVIPGYARCTACEIPGRA